MRGLHLFGRLGLVFHDVVLGGEACPHGGAGEQLADHRPALPAAVETGDRDVREDRPYALHQHFLRQFVIAHRFQIDLLAVIALHLDREFRRGRQALVRAIGEVVGAVVEIRTERVLVQHRQVIEIEIAVIGRLPVRPFQRALRKQRPTFELECLEQVVEAAQVIGDIELGMGIERDPDQSGVLIDRELGQAMLALVDASEILGIRHPDQIAVGLEGPAVIAAGKAAGIAAAIGQRVAAVGAHVEEGAHAAVLLAAQKQRHAADVHRLEIARVRQLARGRDQQRQAAEDLLLLELEQRLVGIGAGRYPHDLVGIFHRIGRAVRDQIAGHGDQFFA